MPGSHKTSRNKKDYKLAVQAVGVSIPNQHAMSVPQKANKVVKCDPGLGAKTISHPFKASKPLI